MPVRHVDLPGEDPDAFPYRQAVSARGFVFVAGQLAQDEPGWADRADTIETETEIAMRRIGRILEAAGASFDDVVSVRVFLRDLSEFARMNAVYQRFFDGRRLPARTCVGVADLLSGGRVEIDCVARRPSALARWLRRRR